MWEGSSAGLKGTPHLLYGDRRKGVETQWLATTPGSRMAVSAQPEEMTMAKTIAESTTKGVVKTDEVGLWRGSNLRAQLWRKARDDAAHVAAHPKTKKPRRKHNGRRGLTKPRLKRRRPVPLSGHRSPNLSLARQGCLARESSAGFASETATATRYSAGNSVTGWISMRRYSASAPSD